jgi:signal transduction histidine kinase
VSREPEADASLADRIFAGNGEMAALVRGTDWSKTPLGPIESWPQSLRTAVSLCLGSRHPIVLWWGPERRMFYNDGYRPMLGKSKHPQFLGRPGRECWAEIWDTIGPMMDQVIETGEATWSEDLLLLMRRSGYLEETYFTFSYSPIRDEAGTPSGIFSACTESTARVLDRRRLKTLREMAVEARTVKDAARLCAETLGCNARDMPFSLVYLFDGTGQTLHLEGHAGLEPGTFPSPRVVNAGKEDGLPWPFARVASRGEVETVDLTALHGLPREPWDEPAHHAMLLPIVRPGTRESAGVLVLGISPRRTFDDDYRGFFELVAGHLATAVSNARAYEKLAETGAALLRDVERKNRELEAFGYSVSHDLRAPLRAIDGFSQALLEDHASQLDADGQDCLRRVRASAKRMAELIDGLLQLSRVERTSLRREAVDISLLGRRIGEVLAGASPDREVTLVVDDGLLADADTRLVEIILENLLGNAWKFTSKTAAPSVALGAVTKDGETIFHVKDNGAGFDEAFAGRLFSPFQRLHAERDFPGTGIGLATAQRIVQRHGGQIWAEGAVGRGATIRWTLSSPRPGSLPARPIR